jgi:Cof subfamily protein (haloacid dehalogenase superfamily)
VETAVRPKLVAIDFDGTLLRSDLTISDRTVDAIKAADRAGIRIMVVTGRPPRWLDPIAELLDHRGTAIAANGALVIDLSSSKVLDSIHFDRRAAAAVIERLRELFPEVSFGIERSDGFVHERPYPRGIRRSERMPEVAYADSDDDLLAEPPVKILARVSSASIDDAADAATGVLDGVADVYFSGTDLLEIAPAGVSKASTLERVATQWDISSDHIVAIGDMPNDIPMITWAGHGVAVANAHPRVRAVADQVTASNDDDGVALVLEALLDPAAAGEPV